MTTELVALQTDRCEDPRFAVCYGRGSVFRRDTNGFFKVEKGSRTVVHRALCLARFYGSRCEVCPNGSISVTLEVQHGSKRAESE